MDEVIVVGRGEDTSMSRDHDDDIAARRMTGTVSPTDTMEDPAGNSPSTVDWTPANIGLTILLMGASGLFEIMGGWMIWMAVRGHQNDKNDGGTHKKPWWFAIVGGACLIVYGFLPTLQPTGSFGRIYAVYGGFFIVLSFLFGWVLDGDRPDMGDLVGGGISLVGVLLVLFWPRG
jgi:small multidrug resistance family-3 protein